ncbi:MAG: protein kinase [Muribaculaceae bacterium]|nr:protein kinase [Muribaculaceae bacterium]MDE6196689.1 protein kinase [Muribaculaceae bacterium]
MTDQTTRWTEIEHLPEWDEEFYHIYTAKKFGKWVMIKTLRPEYADDPRYQAMIEQEFDVRYSLAHPNIIMINDFEDIPGIGRCIITDDVYGDSLRKLIDNGKVTPAVIEQLRHQLVNALEYIQSKHIVHSPLKPENILFTENIGNLKLIDVGFEQRPSLSHQSTSDDIYNYGKVLTEALDAAGNNDSTLRRVARRCTDPDPKKRFRDMQQVHLALENRGSRHLFLVVIAFLSLMILLLLWLKSPYAPSPVTTGSAGFAFNLLSLC